MKAFKKKPAGIKRAGLCLAFAMAVIAGCGRQELGAAAKDPALQGTTTRETMFEGAIPSDHMRLGGDALQSGESYVYYGCLTVDGDIADNVDLDITNGRLIVNGDIGNGCRISVTLPQATHEESYIYTTYIMVGRTMIPQTHTGHRTVVDGLLFPQDASPAAAIEGVIGDNVRITTNGGIKAAGWGEDFRYSTDYGRLLSQNTESRRKTAAPRP